MKIFIFISTLVFMVLSQTALNLEGSPYRRSKDLELAPPPLDHHGKSLIPVDIVKNQVRWTISDENSTVTGEALVQFVVSEAGYPFLLLNPNSVATDASGSPVEISPLEREDLTGNYFYLNQKLTPGVVHQIRLNYSFSYSFANNKNFLPLDYGRHSYIEAGIPANALFDHFPVDLTISMENSHRYELITNGSVRSLSKDLYRAQFPDTFTSISHFIDFVPKQALVIKRDFVTSTDGRRIEVVVYSTKNDPAHHLVEAFLQSVKPTFHNLEKKYGIYPYDRIVVNVSDKGPGTGSYAGAMSLSSFYVEHIAHELSHHWFLQSVSPLNGADTWLYEGLGFWVPYLDILGGFTYVPNLKKTIHLSEGLYSLWSHSKIFQTSEIQSPHQAGAMVIAAINQYIKTNGQREDSGKGLSPILKKIFTERRHQTMSTADFKRLLEKHTGLNFQELFEYYFENY